MTPPSSSRLPLGVLLALLAGLPACRARDGERCICAEDCREGLVCVAEGRVLAAGDCAPAVGENANPGVCVEEELAGEDDGGGGPPVLFMDLGAKRDFDPGLPPTPVTGTETDTGGSTTDATGSPGTDSTGTAGSTGSTGGTSTAGSTGTGSTGTAGSSSGSSSGN